MRTNASSCLPGEFLMVQLAYGKWSQYSSVNLLPSLHTSDMAVVLPRSNWAPLPKPLLQRCTSSWGQDVWQTIAVVLHESAYVFVRPTDWAPPAADPFVVRGLFEIGDLEHVKSSSGLPLNSSKIGNLLHWSHQYRWVRPMDSPWNCRRPSKLGILCSIQQPFPLQSVQRRPQLGLRPCSSFFQYVVIILESSARIYGISLWLHRWLILLHW